LFSNTLQQMVFSDIPPVD